MGSPLMAARARRLGSTEVLQGIPWSSAVSVPQAYRSRGSTIPQTEQRGITLPQLATLTDLVQRVVAKVELRDAYAGDARITWDTVNLYHMNEHFVKPLTARFKSSFVEMVAEAPQTPTWFVSHWWGTPFHQTSELLNFHAKERELPADAPYWICTFANNQHDLSELAGELEATPFVRAILSEECQGTLALLDKGVTTFERIWCVLEHHVSTTRARANKPQHLFDIAAWLSGDAATYGGQPVPAKPTLRMDLSNGRMKEIVQDESTGGAFPLRVSMKGANIDIVNAQASRPEDRRSILHLIAGTPELERADTEPPAQCDAYLDISNNARSMFASGAMYRAAVQGDIKELARLLEDFPDLKDDGISDGASPLYAAAWKGNLEAMELLLSSKADPNRQKDDGATPVFVATQAGNKEALQILLDARADPNLARVADGVGPLFMATQKKHFVELELLLAAGADANALTEKGATSLHLAAQEGHSKAVKILLDGRADPNFANALGITPLAIALQRNRQKIAKMLKDAGGTGGKAQQQCPQEELPGQVASEGRAEEDEEEDEDVEGERGSAADAAAPGARSTRSVAGAVPLPPAKPPPRGSAANRGPPPPRIGAGIGRRNVGVPVGAGGDFQMSMAAMGGIVGVMGDLDGPGPGPAAARPSAGPRRR